MNTALKIVLPGCMTIRRIVLMILLIFAFISPAFVKPAMAGGNLTVVYNDMAPRYINTNQSYPMLNLSLNASSQTGDGINITYINITINGSALPTNISIMEIRNATGSVIVSNTTNSSLNNFTIWFPGGFYVNTTTNTSITVNINVTSFVGARWLNLSLNMTSNASFALGSTGGNISIIGVGSAANGSAATNISQIQDLHAYARVSPLVVDTNVTNQSFVYILNVTGLDEIRNITIALPPGYNVTNVTFVKYGDTILYNVPLGTNNNIQVLYEARSISINFTGTGNNGNVTINFTASTNVTNITMQVFNITIGGYNLTNIATFVNGANTSVTTQQMLVNVTIFSAKTTAYVNGTDYWEFNITFNTTANVSGLLQFKMDDWLDNTGKTIGLNTTSGTYYSTLRSNTNASAYDINITTQYNYTAGWGVPLNLTSTSTTTVYLRMIIPSTAQVSSSWWSVYRMLFRVTP